MKTTKTWKEFIEFAIPDEKEREEFRQYIKNTISGVGNKKALVLYGTGANGKSVLMYILFQILEYDECIKAFEDFIMNPKENIEDILGSKAFLSMGKPILDKSFHEHARLFIKKEVMTVHSISESGDTIIYWPDLIIATNENIQDSWLQDVSLVINMPNIPERKNHHLTDDLIDDIDGIKAWFLNSNIKI